MMSKADGGSAIGRSKGWEWHREEKRARYKLNYNIGYNKFGHISKSELFLVGLALYWSEGSKHDRRVHLVNSDPGILLLYLQWLERCFGINKDQIVCRVAINIVHADRESEIKRYWSQTLGIPQEQFTKTTLINLKWKKSYENRNTHYGVLAVHVRSSTDLSYQVEGSIARLRGFNSLMVE